MITKLNLWMIGFTLLYYLKNTNKKTTLQVTTPLLPYQGKKIGMQVIGTC